MSSKRGKQKEAVEEDFEAFVRYRVLFYDYFHHEKFPNIPVSLVSELHNYSTRSASSNQVAIPLFRTNLRRFCPSIIGSFFWNDIPQSIRDKPSKKMVPSSIPMNQYPFYNFLSHLSFFLYFFINNLKSFVILNFKGHNISLSRCAPLLSFQYTI